LPLFLNFILEYSLKKAQVNQQGMKMNGTHQLLILTGQNLKCYNKIYKCFIRVTKGWRKLHKEEHYDLYYSSSNTIGLINHKKYNE
jgi:hypothetical protein